MALLVLRRVGLCVGQNQMCHLCGWLKLFLKNVRWEKIKIQKRWLLGRLSDGSFVPLLYVPRPEKCLHLLINHPDLNLHIKINPEYALQFFIFALPMKAEMSSAEEQLIRK